MRVCVYVSFEREYKIHLLPSLDSRLPSCPLISMQYKLCSVLHSHEYLLCIYNITRLYPVPYVLHGTRSHAEISAIRAQFILRLSQELNPRNLDEFFFSFAQIRCYFPKIHTLRVNFYLNKTKLLYVFSFLSRNSSL